MCITFDSDGTAFSDSSRNWSSCFDNFKENVKPKKNAYDGLVWGASMAAVSLHKDRPESTHIPTNQVATTILSTFALNFVVAI